MIKQIDPTLLRKHIAGVLGFLTYEVLVGYMLTNKNHVINFAMFYLVEVPFFYLTSFYVLPLFRGNFKKIMSALCMSILALTIFVILQYGIGILEIYRTEGTWSFEVTEKGVKRTMARGLHILGYALAYMLGRLGIQKEREASVVLIQNYKLENENLRARLDQHELFNNLNAVYAIVADISQEAADAVSLVIKRSRYALGKSLDNGHALLTDAIENLKDSIELIKIRKKGNVFIELTVELANAAAGLSLPPHILSNFLDNVCKHGVVTDPLHPACISIMATGRTITVDIENLVGAGPDWEGFGIGLHTLKQQLDRTHQGAYVLKADVEGDHYHLHFEIEV